MISVIIPIYNAEKYIEKCVVSVLAQTYTDFELLLINDGSTDSSQQICSQWAQKDSRIIVISQPNSGVSTARNMGLDRARGEFIYFIDADDWIAPDCFEKMMAKMSDDVDLVISDYQRPDENGNIIRKYDDMNPAEGVYTNADCMAAAYTKPFYVRVVWGKLYRKRLWEHIRFKHLSYSEDTYALFEILMLVQKFYSLEEPLYYYLQRKSSVSSQRKFSHFQELLQTLLFEYEKAIEAYPEFLESATRSFFSQCHILLKLYCESNQKDNAFKLIKWMKTVYKDTQVPYTDRIYRVLALPDYLVFLYAKIKCLLKKEEELPEV